MGYRRTALLALLLLAGCAGTTQYQTVPQGDVGKGTATVHVVRPNAASGGAVQAPVMVNQIMIGRIGPGGHLSTPVPAGSVRVTSTTADAVVQAVAGGEYFFEVTMPIQLWMTQPDFNVKPISREQAKPLL